MSKTDNSNYQLATKAIRSGENRTAQNEHSLPIFATSSFVFDSAEQAAKVFAGDADGNIYSRFTNPTVKAFEQKIASLEGGELAVATASGMGAILTICMSYLKTGDHIVVSRNVFGTIVVLFEKYLTNFGIEVSFVDLTNINDWQQNIKSNTKMLFLETPSNPLTQIADIKQLADLAHQSGSILVVDNVFCTPVLQQPLALGADLVVHSATKYIDGQGRAIGGVVIGSGELIANVFSFVRTGGTSMSPFNAWIFANGLETLKIRVEGHCNNAYLLAQWLEQQPNISQVYYPWLKSHPQHQLARQQQIAGGGLLSFTVKGGKDVAWKIMDSAKMICITANLGDVKTILTHPASTTHGRLSDEQKVQAGITDNLIRISVGLEDISDIKADLALGFS